MASIASKKKKPRKGRLDRVKEKYHKIPEFIIDELSKNDPSGNNKYLEWSCSQLQYNYSSVANCKIIGGMYYHPVARCIEHVNDFHRMSSRLTGSNVFDAIQGVYHYFPNDFRYTENKETGRYTVDNTKDINTYNLDSLHRILGYIKKWVPTDSELKKEVDVIFEDDKLLVLSPLTEIASCKYGSNTRWCTAARNHCHFDTYTDDNEGLVYFIFKDKFRRPDNRYTSERTSGEKIALHWEIGRKGRLFLNWFNIVDDRINVDMGIFFNDYYAQIINGGDYVGIGDKYNTFVHNNEDGHKSTKVLKEVIKNHIKEKDSRSKFKKFFRRYKIW